MVKTSRELIQITLAKTTQDTPDTAALGLTTTTQGDKLMPGVLRGTGSSHTLLDKDIELKFPLSL